MRPSSAIASAGPTNSPAEVTLAGVTVGVLRLTGKRYLSAFSVRGFPGKSHQVFLNPITNALEPMPSGVKLRCATTSIGLQRRGFSVHVTDTGISRRDAKRLFEPFFATKSVKSTLLALWIGGGIVLKYGGRISLRSYCPAPKRLGPPRRPGVTSYSEMRRMLPVCRYVRNLICRTHLYSDLPSIVPEF